MSTFLPGKGTWAMFTAVHFCTAWIPLLHLNPEGLPAGGVGLFPRGTSVKKAIAFLDAGRLEATTVICLSFLPP